jgi:2-desacetyl-2-hydroxyethyl bacteriochlorophyllide A dehydrogenase
MKAAFLPSPNARLEVRDTAVPEPGPGEVRIRMIASGVCGTDIHVWHGLFPVQYPLVLGHEPVGLVDAVGAGVSALRTGDRVGVSWVQGSCGRCGHCQRQRPGYCEEQRTWMNHGGGHREFMIAEAAGCTLVPDGLDAESAAPMFCAGYTVMSGYRNARPRPGERIAVVGIGGLGHLAVQVAKAFGHEVVAVTGSAAKRAEALELGADEVLVVREHAGEELMALGGVDVVISTSNSMRHNSQVLAGLRPEGRLVTMAVGEGAIEVDPMLALSRQIQVIGSMQDQREDLVDVLALAAAGKVVPKLELYRLDQVNELMERQRDGKVRYRGVLQIG